MPRMCIQIRISSGCRGSEAFAKREGFHKFDTPHQNNRFVRYSILLTRVGTARMLGVMLSHRHHHHHHAHRVRAGVWLR
jgi:hypothetical protein